MFYYEKDIKESNCVLVIVGITQIGLTATTIEASPRSDMQLQNNQRQTQENNRHNQQIQQQDKESAQKWNDQQWQENQRHDQSMQRQNNESDHNFNNRQWQENQTHNQMILQIETDVIGMFLN